MADQVRKTARQKVEEAFKALDPEEIKSGKYVPIQQVLSQLNAEQLEKQYPGIAKPLGYAPYVKTDSRGNYYIQAPAQTQNPAEQLARIQALPAGNGQPAQPQQAVQAAAPSAFQQMLQMATSAGKELNKNTEKQGKELKKLTPEGKQMLMQLMMAEDSKE